MWRGELSLLVTTNAQAGARMSFPGICRTIIAAALAVGLFVGPLSAGTLDPPGAPDSPGSAMFTITDIYNRLATGEAGTKRAGAFAEPASTPGATGRTLNEVMAVAPSLDAANGAVAAYVRDGKTFWGLTAGGWGVQTGSMLTRTLSPDSVDVLAGYYAATTLTAVDADLASTNIRGGVSLFGVPGDANVANTASGTATAGDILSGKIGWVDGASVTGTLTAGDNVTAVGGSPSASIPDGVYSGKTASFSDADLVAGNIASGLALFGVTGTAVLRSGNAVVGEVFTGKTFSNAGATGLTGTMPDRGAVSITPGTDNQAIAAGYHNGAGSVAGDADLVSGNIRSGVNLFGVDGNSNVVDTSAGTAASNTVAVNTMVWVNGALVTGTRAPGTAPARVAKTGQILCFDPANGDVATVCNSCVGDCSGQDGQVSAGAGKVNPRFTDNGNGTVTDNLTGLMWLKAALGGVQTLGTALTSAVTYNTNVYAGYADWRLPNMTEFLSLIDFDRISPALPKNHPFTNLVLGAAYYFTSTTTQWNPSLAWGIRLADGFSSVLTKVNWCGYATLVRGGQ